MNTIETASSVPGREKPQTLGELIESCAAEFEPRTATAAELVHDLALCRWRTLRRARLEARLLAAEPAPGRSQSRVCLTLARLGRYQARCRRTWDLTLETLHELQRTTPGRVPAGKMKNEFESKLTNMASGTSSSAEPATEPGEPGRPAGLPKPALRL